MLSTRLNEVALLVEKDLVLADIGCDHALLVIELIKTGKLEKAYAIDNKKEPLNQAIRNIKEAGLIDRVIPLLGNGLNNLPVDVQQITIAGLGGSLIAKIIDNPKLIQIENLVLEANNDVPYIRRKLMEKGYHITDEKLVKDSGIIYEIVKAKKGHQQLSEDDIYFGPLLRQNKDDLFYEKWTNYYQYLSDVYAKIPKKYEDKRQALALELKKIKKEIENGI